MIKYLNYTISWQEVPNEVSLSFNLTKCPGHCYNCHSPELQEDAGNELIISKINEICLKYSKHITCVTFFGGDNDLISLVELIKSVNHIGFKTCVYSGLIKNDILFNLFELDYLKLGPYVDKLGGLKSKNTNQIFYKKNNGTFENITSYFWQ